MDVFVCTSLKIHSIYMTINIFSESANKPFCESNFKDDRTFSSRECNNQVIDENHVDFESDPEIRFVNSIKSK